MLLKDEQRNGKVYSLPELLTWGDVGLFLQKISFLNHATNTEKQQSMANRKALVLTELHEKVLGPEMSTGQRKK